MSGPKKKHTTIRERVKQLSSKELKKAVPREEPGSTRDEGSFTYGYCKSCQWVGHGRRSRDKARRDALEHAELCPGKSKVRVATADTKKPENPVA